MTVDRLPAEASMLRTWLFDVNIDVAAAKLQLTTIAKTRINVNNFESEDFLICS